MIFRVFLSALLLLMGLPVPCVSAGLPPTTAVLAPTPADAVFSMRGVRIDPKNPLALEFIFNLPSNKPPADLEALARRSVENFVTVLTLPAKDIWVNLSPYESDRILPDKLSLTDTGRELLEQDRLLKQFAASMVHPDSPTGRVFWTIFRRRALERFGTTEIDAAAAHKVWVLPDTARVFETKDGAFITQSHLKVMMEEDYLAMKNGSTSPLAEKTPGAIKLSTEVFREVALPVIEKEVNEGSSFAELRRIYDAMILACWFKKKARAVRISAYADSSRIAGLDTNDPVNNATIYAHYISLFRDGVVNIVREDADLTTGEVLPRKYFSGGIVAIEPAQIQEDAVPPVMTGEFFAAPARFEEIDRAQTPLANADRLARAVSAISIMSHGTGKALSMDIAKFLLMLQIEVKRLKTLPADKFRLFNELQASLTMYHRLVATIERIEKVHALAIAGVPKQMLEDLYADGHIPGVVAFDQQGLAAWPDALAVIQGRYAQWIQGLENALTAYQEMVGGLSSKKELLVSLSRVRDFYIPALKAYTTGKASSKTFDVPKMMRQMANGFGWETKADWTTVPDISSITEAPEGKFLARGSEALLWMVLERMEENARTYMSPLSGIVLKQAISDKDFEWLKSNNYLQESSADEGLLATDNIVAVLSRYKTEHNEIEAARMDFVLSPQHLWKTKAAAIGVTDAKSLHTTYRLETYEVEGRSGIRVVFMNPGQLTAEQLSIDGNTGVQSIFNWNFERRKFEEGGTSMPFARLAAVSMGWEMRASNVEEGGIKMVRFEIDLPSSDAAMKLQPAKREVGGIDLDEKNLSLVIDGNGASTATFAAANPKLTDGIVPRVGRLRLVNDINTYLR